MRGELLALRGALKSLPKIGRPGKGSPRAGEPDPGAPMKHREDITDVVLWLSFMQGAADAETWAAGRWFDLKYQGETATIEAFEHTDRWYPVIRRADGRIEHPPRGSWRTYKGFPYANGQPLTAEGLKGLDNPDVKT